MTDFKHVEEMIAKLPKGCCWLKKDVGGSHHDDPCPACREKRAAADTMQALLDGARWIQRIAKQPLLDEMPEEYEGGDPEGAYDSIVIEARDALAKPQEQNDG